MGSEMCIRDSFKVVILLLIVFAGFAALAGRTIGEAPHNFANAFSGASQALNDGHIRSDVSGVSACLYNVRSTSFWDKY